MRDYTKKVLPLLILAGVVPAAAHGRPAAPAIAGGASAAEAGADCAEGVVKDDGTIESGYGWVPSAIDGRYVQEFRSWEFPTRKIDEICVCWTRTRPDDELTFTVELYRNAGGRPSLGADASLTATASMVPAFPEGAFVSVDVSDADMIAPHGTFFIGVRWNPSEDQFFFTCVDQTPTTDIVDGWFIDDRADGWESVLDTSDPIFTDHRAMMIRARAAEVFDEPVPTLGFWGIAVLIAALAAIGWLVIRRGPGR